MLQDTSIIDSLSTRFPVVFISIKWVIDETYGFPSISDISYVISRYPPCSPRVLDGHRPGKLPANQLNTRDDFPAIHQRVSILSTPVVINERLWMIPIVPFYQQLWISIINILRSLDRKSLDQLSCGLWSTSTAQHRSSPSAVMNQHLPTAQARRDLRSGGSQREPRSGETRPNRGRNGWWHPKAVDFQGLTMVNYGW